MIGHRDPKNLQGHRSGHQAKASQSKPALKNSFITRVGDIYCGVGYYK